MNDAGGDTITGSPSGLTPAEGRSATPRGEARGKAWSARVDDALTAAHQQDWAAVVASTLRTARDLDLAEECVQEAYAAAVQSWRRDGIPANPVGWLTTIARRRAVDVIRREQTFRSKLPLLIEPDSGPSPVEDRAMDSAAHDGVPDPTGTDDPEATVIDDDPLRLIFLCCHPALPAEGQVALTLRLVCGVATADVAKTFLVSESTMAARITRAKKKIVGSRVPFRMPTGAELPDRLDAVLAAVYLMFTTGHTAPSGPDLVRTEVVDAAIRLARALHTLMPDETEVAGLLALLLVTDARRGTRVSETGRLLQLQDQDRSRWNRAQLAEGDTLVVQALRQAHGRPGRYTVQAAIASLYAEPDHFDDTDWVQILALYDELLRIWPSPVVALNRIVSLSHVAGPATALRHLDPWAQDPRLTSYPYLPVVTADLLERLGRREESAEHYRRALELTDNRAEQEFLREKIRTLT